eukprot:g58922.t1
MICSSCGVDLSSPVEESEARLRSHYKSDWHRYNVKLKVAGLAAIPEAVFSQKVASLLADKQNSNLTYRCDACAKVLKSAAAYESHLKTKMHLKRVQRTPSRASSVSSTDGADPPSEPPRPLASSTPADPTVQTPSIPIPPKSCLFCSREFRTLRNNVVHMLHDHGMFLPFSEYLDDLQGLLEYLGAKVGQGHICLWCNKQSWNSTEALRQHMKALGHCKIRLDSEDDEEELIDFYKFPKPGDIDNGTFQLRRSIYAEPFELPGLQLECMSLEIERKVLNALLQLESEANRPNKALSTDVKQVRASMNHINEFGEIVLTDGRRIGHRQNLLVYRQNIRDSPSRESVMISQMSRKQITMPGVTDPALQKKAKKKEYLDRLRYYAQMADYRLRVGVKKEKRQKKSAYLDYGC